MEVIPSIYILDGKVVSLYKGKIEQKETYYESPAKMLEDFVNDGAKEIFFLDLNGSKDGALVNEEIIKAAVKQFPDIKFYVAGGIRTESLIDKLFDYGVTYVVIGSSSEDQVPALIQKYTPEKLFFGIKAQGSKLLSSIADRKGSQIDVLDYAIKLEEMGAQNIIYADLASQGTLTQPNYDEVDRLILATSLNVYTQGGISMYKTLSLLAKIGTKGVLIGKAFYENKLSLKECLKYFKYN